VPYMQSEIAEQPLTIERLLRQEGANIAAVAAAIERRQPAYILIAARGTSDNAATYAKYLFGIINRMVVALAAPSLFTLYGAKPDLSRAVVIGVSQSGESTDVVEVVQQARQAGALTIGMTNNPSSPLAASADQPILLHAGEEKALPATKTYTAELAAFAMLSVHLAGNRAMLNGLAALPAALQATLAVEPVLAQAAARRRDSTRCVCLARGLNYATALEAALKLKETCYVGAEPYSTADFMHGPFAVVEPGFPVLLFAAPGKTEAAMIEMAQALAERKAASIVVGRSPEALGLAETPVAMPAEVDELLSPIAYILPAQLFALYLALAKGLDPDAPRGLHKVTLTR
jgi:glutamine---fructose-6-phosphate transaminase (isomerizing)